MFPAVADKANLDTYYCTALSSGLLAINGYDTAATGQARDLCNSTLAQDYFSALNTHAT